MNRDGDSSIGSFCETAVWLMMGCGDHYTVPFILVGKGCIPFVTRNRAFSKMVDSVLDKTDTTHDTHITHTTHGTHTHTHITHTSHTHTHNTHITHTSHTQHTTQHTTHHAKCLTCIDNESLSTSNAEIWVEEDDPPLLVTSPRHFSSHGSSSSSSSSFLSFVGWRFWCRKLDLNCN